MAPVEYMPAATMNKAPTVSIPEFEKPSSNWSNGARRKVMVRARAPKKTAAGGILVLIRSPKVRARMAMVM